MNQLTSPLSKLFQSTLDPTRVAALSEGQRFIDEGGSVLQLVKMGHAGVMQQFALSAYEAQVVLNKANSLLVHVARQFRQHRVTRHTLRNPLHYSGFSALVDSPDYEGLFKPAWGNTTPAGNLDANDSPAAYLVELYSKALNLEADGGTRAGTKIKMFERRPDLVTRKIDPQMAYDMTPTVVLVNQVLGCIIGQQLDKPLLADEIVDDRLLSARHPMTTLPFEWYREQWNYVLQQNGLSLGDMVRVADEHYPYWKEAGAHGGRSSIAMRQASGLGPAMQALVLEERYSMGAENPGEKSVQRSDPRTGRIDANPSITNDNFFLDNFGAPYDDLLDAVKFCTQASIDSDELARLLSIERYAPHMSVNITGTGAITPKTFGSVYINAEGVELAIGVAQPTDKEPARLLTGASERHFDLINRMLRLARWMNLPYDQCDRLLVAAIRAESRKSANEPVLKQQALQIYKITDGTLRAIGLFEDFRRAFNCSAEDFAALIDDISVYACGEAQSQFDQIFNGQSLFAIPLQLDGGKFAIYPQTESDRRTVDQIRSGLGISEETWRYLARVVAECYGLRGELERSVRVVSGLYRLVKLASFFRMTTIELAALLETMSPQGSDWLREILGQPHIGSYRTIDRADVLDVLHAVQSCVAWCRENDLEPIWLVQHVSPVEVPSAASEAELTLLQELRRRLEPTRVKEEALTSAGVPAVSQDVGADWMTLLAEVFDAKGVVKGLADNNTSYELWAAGEINAAVGLARIDPTQVERVEAIILAIVLQAQAAQSAVVQEGLSVYLNLAQDLVLGVLTWVEGDGVYLLLNETMRVVSGETQGAEPIAIGDDILKVLAHLMRRAAVVKKLTLSSAMLGTLTTREHWRWFGLQQIEELNLHTFYLLTLYNRAVIHTEESAEKLLAYLKMVNELPAQLTPEDVRLIRDGAASALAQAVKWGIKEVLRCANYLAPELPLIREMSQVDFVIRARGIAAKTGLDANAILGLGRVSPESDVVSCRQAAEHAVQCLSESAIQSKAQAFGEVGQSVSGTMTVSANRLIANAPDQYARVEVVLQDFENVPLRNITVTWECKRSGLQDLQSTTDHEGRASTRFKSGSWMGLAKVIARFGMGQEVVGEGILVDCDDDSLDFTFGDTSQPPFAPKLAGNHEFLELQVRLRDDFGNFAADRPVRWASTAGTLDPVESFTDKDGFARTRVRSRDAVENLSVTAAYANGDPLYFEEISFVDRPRVTLLEANSPAVEGRELELRALVVGLDGRPYQGASVTFYKGDTQLGTYDSDEDGVATCDVADIVAGPLTFRASVEHGSQSLQLTVASGAVIHGQSADYLLPVAGSDRPSLLWVEVRETASNDATPIPRFPIMWSVVYDGDTSVNAEESMVPTDLNGRSTFPFVAAQPGNYTVTAQMEGAADKVEFALEVVEPLAWLITLIDVTDPQAPVEQTLPPGAPLNLSHNHNYRLELVPETAHDLTGARVVLGWSAPFSAKAMGLTFAPLTGQYVEVSAQPMTWNLNCANLRSGSFELTWLCNRIDQTLILSGYVWPGAPVVQHPRPGSTVEPMMVIGGTASPGNTLQVFIGKDLPYRAQAQADAQGQWSVQLPRAQAAGPCVLSVKQLAADGTEYWAEDVTVSSVAGYFAMPHFLSPVMDAEVTANPEFQGFGRPGAEMIIVEPGSTIVRYGSTTVAPNGRWVISSSKLDDPKTYPIAGRLSDSNHPTPTEWARTSITVVAAVASRKKDT